MTTTTDISTEVIEPAADPKDVAAANALLTIKPAVYVKQVFDEPKKALAKAVRAAEKTEAFNIQTTAGMETAKRLRLSFKTIRTGVENLRKERKAPIIEIGRMLDDAAAAIKDAVLPHEEKYDKMIKAEEARKEAIKQEELAKERARIEAIENRLQLLRDIPKMHLQSDSETIAKAITEHSTVALDPEDYDEFNEAALAALNASIVELQRMHGIVAQREADARKAAEERAELERLRAERAAEEQRRKAEEEARAAEQRKRDEEAAALAAQREREIAELRAQLAAATAPKVEPVPEPEPQMGLIDVAPDATVEAAPVIEVPTYAEARDEVAVRPTDSEIITVLASHYDVDRQTVIGWLRSLDL